MPHLVAIDLPGGDRFVDALRRIWDAGDAAFPLDRRLPAVARRAILDAIDPDRLIDADGVHKLDGRGVEEGDALVVSTSGTTGTPRGVVLTHDAIAASATATSARLAVTGDDTWLACLPLSHVGGLSVVTRALASGTPLMVHDGFDAEAVSKAARHGATLVSLVPTALRRIESNLFRRIVLGGSQPPQHLPDNVVTTYGMTETGSGIVYDGRPLDGVEVRVDVDAEIHIRCPMLLRCYRDGEAPLVDGWFASGDLGELGDDGRLIVHGRRGDLIITGGENVWPAAVEAALIDHPRDCGGSRCRNARRRVGPTRHRLDRAVRPVGPADFGIDSLNGGSNSADVHGAEGNSSGHYVADDVVGQGAPTRFTHLTG